MQADERTALIGWLDLQRQILRWKCGGLSEADAHRPVIPTSPAMTMAGLISHMRWAEHTWLEVLFLGGDKTQNPGGRPLPTGGRRGSASPFVQTLR